MKTGNIISLALVLFLLALALFCDLVLASQYRKVNLADPFKNFNTVGLKPFKVISITGGNGYAIQLRTAQTRDIKLLNSRKGFFAMRYSGDTAYIAFRVANQTYQSPENCIIGLIISTPELPACVLNGVNTVISGFKNDTIKITAGHKAQVRVNNIQTRKLQIIAENWSSLDLQQKNQADFLLLNLSRKASVTLNEIRFNKLEKSLTDSANLVLYDPGLKAIWKYIDPVSRAKEEE